jgi:hypothetical protein
LSNLIVPYEISWLVAVIVVALYFLLKSPRGLPGLTILFRGGLCYLIYLVRVAILFFEYRDRFPLWRDTFRFLRSAPEIVVQAYSLTNQDILIRREALNSHGVLNIRPQSFIELSHLSTFIPVDPERVLREPS